MYLLLCQNVFDAYKYIFVLGYVFGSYLNFLIIFFSELIVDMYLNAWRKSYKNIFSFYMEFCELNKEQRESFALFVKPRTFFNLSIKVLIKIFLSVNKCTLEIFLKMFCDF